MGNSVSRAKGGIFSGKKRKNSVEKEEYSQEEIQKKFRNIPKLTLEEKKVLKSSWKLIAKKLEKVGLDCTKSIQYMHITVQ